jgi:hypothetical protein
MIPLIPYVAGIVALVRVHEVGALKTAFEENASAFNVVGVLLALGFILLVLVMMMSDLVRHVVLFTFIGVLLAPLWVTLGARLGGAYASGWGHVLGSEVGLIVGLAAALIASGSPVVTHGVSPLPARTLPEQQFN